MFAWKKKRHIGHVALFINCIPLQILVTLTVNCGKAISLWLLLTYFEVQRGRCVKKHFRLTNKHFLLPHSVKISGHISPLKRRQKLSLFMCTFMCGFSFSQRQNLIPVWLAKVWQKQPQGSWKSTLMVPGTPQAFANANKDKETFLKKTWLEINKSSNFKHEFWEKKTFNLPRGYC